MDSLNEYVSWVIRTSEFSQMSVVELEAFGEELWSKCLLRSAPPIADYETFNVFIAQCYYQRDNGIYESNFHSCASVFFKYFLLEDRKELQRRLAFQSLVFLITFKENLPLSILLHGAEISHKISSQLSNCKLDRSKSAFLQQHQQEILEVLKQISRYQE
jgi:hypothetical protein